MKYVSIFSVVFFSIFLGSQITEGVLLVPYWQSLSAPEFFIYYNVFGPAIGQFYTILTIIAALIPIALSIYAYLIKSLAFKYSMISSLFALLFIACFYVYFKEVNELFFQSAFDQDGLKNELIIWSQWHWGRVFIESLSLIFLVIAIEKLNNEKGN